MSNVETNKRNLKYFLYIAIIAVVATVGIMLYLNRDSINTDITSDSTCKATTKEGKSCNNKRAKGSSYCYRHK